MIFALLAMLAASTVVLFAIGMNECDTGDAPEDGHVENGNGATLPGGFTTNVVAGASVTFKCVDASDKDRCCDNAGNESKPSDTMQYNWSSSPALTPGTSSSATYSFTATTNATVTLKIQDKGNNGAGTRDYAQPKTVWTAKVNLLGAKLTAVKSPLANVGDRVGLALIIGRSITDLRLETNPQTTGLPFTFRIASATPDTPDKGMLIVYRPQATMTQTQTGVDVDNNGTYFLRYKTKLETSNNKASSDPILQEQTVKIEALLNNIVMSNIDVSVLSHFHYLKLRSEFDDAIFYISFKYSLNISASYNGGLQDYGKTHNITGSTQIGVPGMGDENTLASTLLHEGIHQQQSIAFRIQITEGEKAFLNHLSGTPYTEYERFLISRYALGELDAYIAEENSFERTALSQVQRDYVENQISLFNNILNLVE